jgi:hypothetical protein
MSAAPAVSVTYCFALVVPIFWLEKVRLAGDAVRLTVAPWPVSATVRGLPGELSVMVSVPVRAPRTVGVKVTWTAQFPPDAETLAQLLDAMAKSPLMVTLETVRASVPRSEIVTDTGELVVPTATAGKDTLLGTTAAAAPEDGEIFMMNASTHSPQKVGCRALNTGNCED